MQDIDAAHLPQAMLKTRVSNTINKKRGLTVLSLYDRGLTREKEAYPKRSLLL